MRPPICCVISKKINLLIYWDEIFAFTYKSYNNTESKTEFIDPQKSAWVALTFAAFRCNASCKNIDNLSNITKICKRISDKKLDPRNFFNEYRILASWK